nr:hypothetical protein [Tanacetum cinerariifolium]
MESQSKTTQTVSALKLPVLKTREYNLWSIRMEQYLTFTDHALWEVIVNGDSVLPFASASAGAEGHIPPKTDKQKLAKKNELKAKSTLMLAIPDEHLLKFYAFNDAKSLKEASRIDLEQINADDLEEIDLKWKVAMLTMQIIAKYKTGLAYDGQMNESDLNDIHVNESEVLDNMFDSAFNNRESDGDDNQVNDRFKKGEGYHAVPPPCTGNYMPPRVNLSFSGLDDSVFKSKVSETVASGKITGPKEIRPVWDNTARVNHQSKLTHLHPKRNFIPATALTKSRQVPVNAAKQSSHRAATSVSAARRVNTAASRPNVNDALPTTYSYFKAHSLRPKRNLIDHISKDNGSYTLKRFYYVDPQGRLKIKGSTILSNRVLTLEQSKTAQDLVIKKLQKKVKRLEKKQRGRNLKTRPMFKEGDSDNDFDDIDDMVDEALENVEGDTVNAGGAVNSATTGVSAASASVTTVGVSISTAEPRTPPTTTTTAFEDEDLTIA